MYAGAIIHLVDLWRIPMFKHFVATLLALSILIAGCQSNPVLPGSDQTVPQDLNSQPSENFHQCLGYYTVLINTPDQSIDVIPVRIADWHLNVVGILNTTMGVSAVAVPSEADPPNGLFVFDITLTHPFGTKTQFAGFDVKGILMTPGSFQMVPTLEPSVVFADLNETQLENADGYTRWWNPTEFTNPGMFGYTHGNLANAPGNLLTATVNPYKHFADGLNTNTGVWYLSTLDLDANEGRGVFKAGESNTRRYRIRFPMDPGPQVVYGYAVDAAWNLPSPNPPLEVPDDFPMDANQPEAFLVGGEPTVNTLFYDSESGTSGGLMRLIFDIRDWQGMVSGQMGDEIDELIIYAPALFDGPKNAALVFEDSMKAGFALELYGDLIIAEAGEHLIGIRVPQSDGLKYTQGVGPAPDQFICAWDTLVIDVIDPECETDSNNSHLDAEEFTWSLPDTGVLCAGTDDEDWFHLEVPTMLQLEGDFKLYCDDPSAGFILHDVNGLVLDGANVVDGIASFNVDHLEIGVGEYFISVFVGGMGDAVTYVVELDGNMIDIRPNNPVDVTPPGLFLDPDWAARNGSVLYFSGLVGFWAYDNTAPWNPLYLSYFEDIHYGTPTFNFPYMYYNESTGVNPTGVDLIDWSDPANPVHFEDSLSVPGEVEFMTMDSGYLYVAADTGPSSEIFIYDYATDPQSPTLVDQFGSFGDVIRLGLVAPDTPMVALVLLTDTYGEVFDVSDPSNVTTYDAWMLIEGEQKDLDIEGNWIATTTVDASDNGYFNLQEYDPGVGVDHRGFIFTASDAEYVDIQGDYAYIGGGSIYGLVTIDMTDPDALLWKGYTETVSASHFVLAEGNLLLNIPEGAAYALFDIASDPAFPVEAFRYLAINQPTDITVYGDYAIIGDGLYDYHALKVLDISDPSNAFIAGEYVMDVGINPIVNEGPMFAVGSPVNDTLYIFDMEDPANPAIITWQAYGANLIDIAINEDVIYVALDDNTLDIWTLASWPIPIHKTPVSLSNTCIRMVIANDTLYVSTLTGIDYYSMTDPFNPTYSGTAGVNIVTHLEASSDRLYLLNSTELVISDITGGGEPTYIGSTTLPYVQPADTFTVTNEYAFVHIEDWKPVTTVKMWPEDSPWTVGDLYPEEIAWPVVALLAHGGYLYENKEIAGVRIWDLY